MVTKIEKEARESVENGSVRQALKDRFDCRVTEQIMKWIKKSMWEGVE